MKAAIRSSLFMSVGTAVLVQAPAPVFAQPSLLEEVLVVARRREEVPQDVPLSMTLVSARQIENLSAKTFKDLVWNVPNAAVDLTGISLSSWGMRGIVSQTRNAGQESGLGVYVDGAYLGRPAGFNVPLNDVEQVEVLRGPQGSLFGRNTIAGAINITTKRPTEELSGYVQGALGNLSRKNIEAGISGPIIEGNVAGKLNAFSYERDGYVDNIFNGEELFSDDRWGGRGALYITPSDELEFVLAADYMEQDNTFTGGQTLEPQLNNFVPVPWYFEDDDVVNQNDPGLDKVEAGGVSFRVNWAIDADTDFSSITSGRVTDFDETNDDDAGPITLTWSNFNDQSDTITQEFLLSGTRGEKTGFVLGAYYLDLEIRSDRVTPLAAYPAVDPAIRSNARVDTKSWALFGSLDYSLTERLDVTLGLRYTDEEKESKFAQVVTGPLPLPNASFSPKQTDDAVSGDLSAIWQATEETNIYASVRRGFKGGGFQTDIINFDSEDLFSFGPEEAWSYEIGLKGVYLDGTLSVDASIFHTDYDDMQVGQLVGLGFTTTNAGESEIDGLELQVTYQPTDRLRMGLSVGLLDHEFQEFDDCSTPGSSCAGNKLQFAPDATWSADIGYTHPLAGGSSLDFFLGANFRDDYFTTAVNDPQLNIDDRTLLDGRIAWTCEDASTTIALWGRNLTDEDWELTRWQYPVTPQAFGGADPTITGGQRTIAEPRTYGVELTYRF